jgi:hypothetical protein
MAQLKHVHRYRRHTYKKSKTDIFFCTLEDCTLRIDPELTIGKRSICNMCGREFIMNTYSIKLKLPHCVDCTKVKVKGPDGKRHYVRKNTIDLLAETAESHVDELRLRLSNLSLVEDGKDI